MTEIKITARSLEWDEYVKFVDEVESKAPVSTADSKDKVAMAKEKRAYEIYSVKAAAWIMKNIYPDLDLKSLTPSEIMFLHYRTMSLTNKVRDEEVKNLTGFSIGTTMKKEKNTVTPVQTVEKPEKKD